MERMLRVIIIGYPLISFSHDSEWYILFFFHNEWNEWNECCALLSLVIC